VSFKGVVLNLKEAQIIIEKYKHFYNTQRPHSALAIRHQVSFQENAMQLDI